MVLNQFAHNLLIHIYNRFKFRVSIPENNWDGLGIIEVGGFWGEFGFQEYYWSSSSQEGCEIEENVPPSSSSVFFCRPE